MWKRTVILLLFALGPSAKALAQGFDMPPPAVIVSEARTRGVYCKRSAPGMLRCAARTAQVECAIARRLPASSAG